MDATELGVVLYCPLSPQLPDVGQEGGTLLTTAETPGFLGSQVSEKGAGGDPAPLQVEVSFYTCSLAKDTAIPFSASLRFKPKPVFLYLKKKKKSKNQTQHLTSCNTWSFFSLSLSPFLFLPSFFPHVLSSLALLPPTFSLPIRDNLGGW